MISETAIPTNIMNMARLLSNRVPEIKDRLACRMALAYAGYTDEQITGNLGRAQRLARQHRAETADRLVREANRK